MIRVAGVRFQQEGKMFTYDAGNLSPVAGDYVVAETARGTELGEVILAVREVEKDQAPASLPRLIRIATAQDIQRATDNRSLEQEAYRVCQRKIAEHKLDMKLVSVEINFDNSRMLFYFTANGRVDFRALVKDLAATFRTRIELRQIGVRDEARMLGGLGPCGRPICCGAFLNGFQPVSIKMAKEQNLSLNPTKISGVCGRLMCCLKYEQDQYEQVRKRMPRVGREVITPDGSGTVTDLNVVKETVSVRIADGDTAEIRIYPLDQIIRPGGAPQAAEAADATAAEPAAEPGGDEAELAILEDAEFSAEFAEKTENPGPSQPPAPRNDRPRTGEAWVGSRPEKKEEPSDSDKNAEGKNGKGKAKGNSARKPAEREQKLGQPVRRENPERGKKPSGTENRRGGKKPEGNAEGAVKPKEEAETRKAADTAEKKAAENGNRKPENPTAGKTGKTGSKPAPKASQWADAVEKALQAADQEK